MEKTINCPKCSGVVEGGFILDAGFLGTLASQQQKWLKGESREGSAHITNKGISIKTYRCINCGYLESYAK